MRNACLLVVLFISVCGWAQTTSTATKSDGNQLLHDCSALVRYIDAGFTVATGSTAATSKFGSDWCIGYIYGFVAGFDAMAMAEGKTYEEYLTLKRTYICFPDGNTLGQDARVLVKFLNDHPERLHEDEGGLVFAAFMNAFPCEPKLKSTTKAK
jgi:hypothetical protein